MKIRFEADQEKRSDYALGTAMSWAKPVFISVSADRDGMGPDRVAIGHNLSIFRGAGEVNSFVAWRRASPEQKRALTHEPAIQ
jgi:hypothetical protein